jgi:hypothetical protein
MFSYCEYRHFILNTKKTGYEFFGIFLYFSIVNKMIIILSNLYVYLYNNKRILFISPLGEYVGQKQIT